MPTKQEWTLRVYQGSGVRLAGVYTNPPTYEVYIVGALERELDRSVYAPLTPGQAEELAHQLLRGARRARQLTREAMVREVRRSLNNV